MDGKLLKRRSEPPVRRRVHPAGANAVRAPVPRVLGGRVTRVPRRRAPAGGRRGVADQPSSEFLRPSPLELDWTGRGRRHAEQASEASGMTGALYPAARLTAATAAEHAEGRTQEFRG